MKTLSMLLVVGLIAGCGKDLPNVEIVNPSPAVTPAATKSPALTENSSSSSSSANNDPSDPPVTYYSYTASKDNYHNAGFTATATGYMAVYNGVTYLWDDGVHSKTLVVGGIPIVNSYTFWGLCGDSESFGGCGTGEADLISQPTIDSQAISNNILVFGFTSANTVLTQGTPSTVDCTENAGVLDCGTFTIDTTQSPIN